MTPMTARDAEAALLARCTSTARDATALAQDQREANVFRLAGMVVRSRFPADSARLLQASQGYFEAHPGEQLSAEEVVRQGWVADLPRLRQMLSHRLSSRLSGQ